MAARNERAYITGELDTPGGPVPVVSVRLTRADRLGSWKARWGMGRLDYTIPPGLYAVGAATAESPVLVSANYKMSFDRLRATLGGIDAWILVLDTRGINVWCAAGKGTFGTGELIHRIAEVRLSEFVSHRKLVVPQLGAVGVSGHEVRSATGFRAVFGPVLAEDLPAFLAAGMKATDEMRRIRFPLWERVILAPVELMMGAKYVLLIAAALVILSGLGPGIYVVDRVLQIGLVTAGFVFVTFLASSVLTPLLLPWLPGRAFAWKGAWIGLAVAVVAWFVTQGTPGLTGTIPGAVSWFLFLPALASFIAMNFTGASTYTSLSGVSKEMRYAVPVQIVSAVVGLALWVSARFVD
jgi:hypothetical protein